MRKLNTYEFYRLGATLKGFTAWEPKEPVKVVPLFFRCAGLRQILRKLERESLVSSVSKSAIATLLNKLVEAGIPEDMPENVEDWEKVNDEIQEWRLSSIPARAKDLETVLQNDLPGLATYYVIQKGIYSTDALTTQACLHIPDNLRSSLSKQAETDINEAGKCLAFELGTASAFHTWRAVEATMDAYHHKLCNKSFEEAGITRNWGRYIPALKEAGADKKITEVLDMIRDKYRNPISHPNENLTPDEAYNLFNLGTCIISQILQEIEKPLQRQLPGTALPSTLSLS